MSDCTVQRAPEDTPDGLAMWYVTPPEGVILNGAAGDRLTVEALPPRTALTFHAHIVAGLPPATLN